MAFFKTALGAAVCVILFSAPAAAEEMWQHYKSESGVFESLIPEEHEERVSTFFVEDRKSVSSEEISALIDQRPFKTARKSYIVKVDQTIGPGLSEEEIKILLNREFGLYEDYYTSIGGKLLSKNTEKVKDFPGGELHMSYNDKTFGKENIKIRMLFSSSTRLVQIVTGPDDILTSFKTRDFFNSLTFSDGITITSDVLDDVWKTVSSPCGMFTYTVPPVTKPFFPSTPAKKYSEKGETVSMVFKDPVRNQSIFYNIYAYRFDRNLSLATIDSFLLKNHVGKQRTLINLKDIAFKHVTQGDKVIFDAAYNIRPPEKFPFLGTVMLRAISDGRNVMVQEIMSSQVLALSPFSHQLLTHVSFHPDLYHPPTAEEQAAQESALKSQDDNDETSQILEKVRQSLQSKITTDGGENPPVKEDAKKPAEAAP